MTKIPASLTWSGSAFVTGLMAGLATALLYAAQPGTKTRRQVRRYADKVGKKTSREVERAKAAVGGMFEEGKKLINWQ